MDAILNNQTISRKEDLKCKVGFKTENCKILFIIHPDTIEKERKFLNDTDAVIVDNITFAKEKISANKKSFFDAFVCDSEFERNDIKDFLAFLTSKGISAHVPSLLINFNTKTNNNDLLKHLNGVDDIITSNITAGDLNQKIVILKKYKFFQSRLPYKAEASEVEPDNCNQIDYQYLSKRILDIIIASILLLLISPLILLISIAIKLESKGPVFYKSQRAGKWYKVFTFFKFRTMAVNADSMIKDLQYVNEYKENKTYFFFKLKDDPRVTRVGKFLRKFSLDELPQLINVLKGDMSIVGNRPLPLYEAETITVDKSAKRFFAAAGMTGLWQVKGRSNQNLSASERIAMDVDYADKSSFLFDIKILFKTPKELIYKGNV